MSWLKSLLFILGIAYPFLVYWGITQYSSEIVTIFICMFLLMRFLLDWDKTIRWVYLISIFLCSITFFQRNGIWIQLYPVLMSFGMFCIFLYSLLFPPTVIERLASLKYSQLDEKALHWVYHVTLVWIIFFFINTIIALSTVLYGSLKIWTFYNGFLSYLLMGMLFIGEWILRMIKLNK